LEEYNLSSRDDKTLHASKQHTVFTSKKHPLADTPLGRNIGKMETQ